MKPHLRSEVYCPDQLYMYINSHACSDVSDSARCTFCREALTPCFAINIEGISNGIALELLDLQVCIAQ